MGKQAGENQVWARQVKTELETLQKQLRAYSLIEGCRLRMCNLTQFWSVFDGSRQLQLDSVLVSNVLGVGCFVF